MKSQPQFLTPIISEPWLRRYQVLPGRTHPEMQGLGHGGFLLTSTRVFDDENANSVTAKMRRGGAAAGKKRKAAEEVGATTTTVEGTERGGKKERRKGDELIADIGNEGLGEVEIPTTTTEEEELVGVAREETIMAVKEEL